MNWGAFDWNTLPTILLSGGFVGLLFWPLWRRARSASVSDAPADEVYRVYTRKHDLTLRARDVPGALDKDGHDRSKGWASTSPELWQRKVADASGATANADPTGKAEMSLREAFADKRAARDWAIGLLVDQSGSMRDDPISQVASGVKWLSTMLGELGVTVGVLGFSTVGWQGGKVYQEWLQNGRPERPGRLCALLHVIYQPFGETLVDEDWGVMLHPDILHENVDGEAIEWAVSLLRQRTETRKLLIVMSDGAPVDDATLRANGPSYLLRHIKSVIAGCEDRNDPVLAAIGINFAVDGYYGRSATLNNLSEFAAATAALISQTVHQTGKAA